MKVTKIKEEYSVVKLEKSERDRIKEYNPINLKENGDKIVCDVHGIDNTARLLLNERNEDASKYLVLGPHITLCKKIHVGHLYGILTGQILANMLGSSHILHNNDTAPGVAKMIEYLSYSTQCSIEDLVNKLKNGEIRHNEIEEAYIMGADLQQSNPINSSGCLLSMNDYTKKILEQIKVHLDIKNESDHLDAHKLYSLSKDRISDSEWDQYGVKYLYIPGKAPIALRKDGEDTINLKLLSFYANLLEEKIPIIISQEHPDEIATDYFKAIGYPSSMIRPITALTNGEKGSGRYNIGMSAEELITELGDDAKNLLINSICTNRSGSVEVTNLIHNKENILLEINKIKELHSALYESNLPDGKCKSVQLLIVCNYILNTPKSVAINHAVNHDYIYQRGINDILRYAKGDMSNEVRKLALASLDECITRLGYDMH